MLSGALSDYAWVLGANEGTEYLQVTYADQWSAATTAHLGFTTSAAWTDQTGLGSDAGASASLLPSDQTLQNGLLAAA